MNDDILKQLTQLQNVAHLVDGVPAYEELRKWQQDCATGYLHPIRHEVLDTIVESEKSVASLLMDQMLFLTDQQKLLLKMQVEQSLIETSNNIKNELTRRKLLC